MGMFGRKKPMYQGLDPEYNARNIPIEQATGTIPMGQQQPEMQPQRFKPNILGVIGDAMQVFGGGQATYMQGMQAEQQRAQMLRDRAAQQQQQRQMQREDMQWEWENKPKEAPNNDTVNDLNWYKSLSDEDRKLYHQMKPVITYRGDGTPVAINPYDLQKSGGPQVGTVEDGYRFKGGNPSDPNAWEKVGGAGSNASGGF